MSAFAHAKIIGCISALLLASSLLAAADDSKSVTLPTVDQNYPHRQPIYPDLAERNGEQGTVAIDLLIRPSGRAVKARVSQTSGYEDLDNAAMEGVLNWRFVPGTSQGEVMSTWTTVKIVYRLPTEGAASSEVSVDLDHDLRDECTVPVPPPPTDGATAPKEKMDANRDLVTAFVSASDRYQHCVRLYVGKREDLAFSVHSTVPKWVYVVAQHKIDLNQRDKEAVGKAFNDAERLYQKKRSPQ
jgi:TonB family protein